MFHHVTKSAHLVLRGRQGTRKLMTTSIAQKHSPFQSIQPRLMTKNQLEQSQPSRRLLKTKSTFSREQFIYETYYADEYDTTGAGRVEMLQNVDDARCFSSGIP